MELSFLLLLPIAAVLLFGFWSARQRARRAAFIRAYPFPKGLLDRFGARHPRLTDEQRQAVLAGLRQFFLAYLQGRRSFVAMPSQVVDDLWHEFILYTRQYQSFCARAFGRFLHHAPAAVLSKNHNINTGLRRVWWQVCREEGIDPRHPDRLPLLFALDERLGIEPGFRYVLHCQGLRRDDGGPLYCGGDMGSLDFDGTTDGFDDGGGGGDGDGGGGCGGD